MVFISGSGCALSGVDSIRMVRTTAARARHVRARDAALNRTRTKSVAKWHGLPVHRALDHLGGPPALGTTSTGVHTRARGQSQPVESSGWVRRVATRELDGALRTECCGWWRAGYAL